MTEREIVRTGPVEKLQDGVPHKLGDLGQTAGGLLVPKGYLDEWVKGEKDRIRGIYLEGKGVEASREVSGVVAVRVIYFLFFHCFNLW